MFYGPSHLFHVMVYSFAPFLQGMWWRAVVVISNIISSIPYLLLCRNHTQTTAKSIIPKLKAGMKSLWKMKTNFSNPYLLINAKNHNSLTPQSLSLFPSNVVPGLMFACNVFSNLLFDQPSPKPQEVISTRWSEESLQVHLSSNIVLRVATVSCLPRSLATSCIRERIGLASKGC